MWFYIMLKLVYTEVRNSRVTKLRYGIKLRKMTSHIELLTQIFLEKFFFRVIYLKREKTKSWFRSRSRFLYWNETLYNSDLFGKKVDMLDFVILDVALNRCCLLSRNYSARVLRYANFFLTLDIRLFYMRYLYKYWDSVGWCKFMDMSIYKIAEYHSQ